MSAYIYFNINLQQISNYNIYSIHINIIRVEEVKQQFRLWIHSCYHQSPLYGACSELLGCCIILTCTGLWGAFPSVLHFFIINDVNIIVSESYPGWLPSETSWPSMGYSSFVWENPLNFISMGLGRWCC